MKALRLWRFNDPLSINEAALLAVGVDPSSAVGATCRSRLSHERPEGYDAISRGIANALRNDVIRGDWQPDWKCDTWGHRIEPIDDSIDYDSSTVDVASLKAWLISGNERPEFFFPVEVDTSGSPAASIIQDCLGLNHDGNTHEFDAPLSTALDDAQLAIITELRQQLGIAQKTIDDLRHIVGDLNSVAPYNLHLMKIALEIQRVHWKNLDKPPKQESILNELVEKYSLSGPEAQAVERVACPINRRK